MRIWIAAIIISWSAWLSAQDRVELFGYFESQFMGAQVHKEFIQLQSNKLRVDLKGRLSNKVTFGANFNFIAYHGKNMWNILDYLPTHVITEVPSDMEHSYIITFSDRIFLDNAYIKLAFDHFDLTVGKQQISYGSGYAWNPTDLFNMKDLLDPTYEQPGHNAIKWDLMLGSKYSITALYAPGDRWERSDKMLLFKGRISHFDYFFITIEKIWRFHDYMQFDQLQNYFTELPEKRNCLGASIAGELLGLGIWAEYGYNRMEKTNDFSEVVFGVDYTFNSQTYVMGEYYRNTLCKTDHMHYTLNDWMRYLFMEQKAIGRDNLFLLIQHPVTDLIFLGISTIVTVNDQSAILVPTLNYNLFEDVDVYAYLNIYLGKEGTALNQNLGSGGLIRVRVYF